MQGYRAIDQDIVLTDSDGTSVAITTTPIQLLSITTTHELTPENGSYLFIGDFANSSTSKERVLTVITKADGVEIRRDDFALWKENEHQNIVMSGSIKTTYPIDTVITIELQASADGYITANGDYLATTLKVTAAQAAPVNIESVFSGLKYESNNTNEQIITAVAPTFEALNSLTSNIAHSGIYEIRGMIAWVISTASSSGILRYSFDGGVTWKEVYSEVKDKTNMNLSPFLFVRNYNAGDVLDFRIEVAKENASADLLIDHSVLIAERKK